MELTGILGALFLSGAIGWLMVCNSTLAIALTAFSLPFDQQIIMENPLTVYTTEALIAGLIGGAFVRRFTANAKAPAMDYRVWILPLLVMAGWVVSFPGSLDRISSIKALIRWMELWIVLAVIAAYIRRGLVDARMVSGGYLAGVVVAGIMILREFVIAPLLLRPSGPISPNSIPPYMGLGLLLLIAGIRPRFGRHDKLAAWLIGILVMASLIASQSRTGVAAGVAGVLVCLALLGWPARKAIIASASIIIILLGIAAIRDWRVMYRLSTYPQFYKSPAFIERVDIYRLGEKIWEERPLLGAGAGNYGLALNGYFTANPRVLERVNKIPLMYSDLQAHAHNLFLHLAIESGIIGLGFWIGALAVLGYLLAGSRGAPLMPFAGGIGLMVVFVFTNMLDITITHSRGVLFAVGWGIFLGLRQAGKDKFRGRSGKRKAGF